MNKFLKTNLFITLVFFLLLFSAEAVFAQGSGNSQSITNPIGDPEMEIEDVVVNITNYLLYIIGTICVLVLVFAGFTYVASAGNEGEIGKAKNRITYAIIGLVVAIIAWVFVNSIVTYLLPGGGAP